MQFSTLSSVVLVAASSVAAVPQVNSELSPRTFGWFGINPSNSWGASIQPWHPSSQPGWYLGSPCNGLPKWNGGASNQGSSGGFSNPLCGLPFSSWIPGCSQNGGGNSGGNGGSHPTTSTSSVATPTSTTSASGATPTSGSGSGSCSNGYKQSFNNYTTTATSGVYQGKQVGAATIDNANYLTYGLVDNLAQCEQVCNGISNCAFINLYQEFNSTIKDSYGANKLTCAAYKACSGTNQATNFGGQNDPTYIVNSSGYCKDGSC